MKFSSVIIKMKANEQYVLSCGAVYDVVQGGSRTVVESVEEILKCDH